jgi:arabinogalactan oligomer/maltooligosaccharide transport system permease protein
MASQAASSKKQSTKFQRWWVRSETSRNIWIYLFPALFVMAIITFIPLLYQLWMSFTDYGITNLRWDSALPNTVGLQNYSDIFSGKLAAKLPNFNFWRLLAFNLFWTFTNVFFHVILGVLIAVLLNQNGLWFKGFYRAIFILPMVLPNLVIAAIWRNMYDPNYGAINVALQNIGSLFGIPPEQFVIRWLDQVNQPIPWLFPGMPLPLSYFALLFANMWLGWPFMTVVATGALQSISNDYYEAADIDGANSRQSFFNITVPLLRPAMVPAIMYGLITTFNLFNLIFFISGGGPLRQTEIMVVTAFNLINGQRLYGMAAAFSVLIFLILLGLTLLTNYVTRATERYDVS